MAADWDALLLSSLRGYGSNSTLARQDQVGGASPWSWHGMLHSRWNGAAVADAAKPLQRAAVSPSRWQAWPGARSPPRTPACPARLPAPAPRRQAAAMHEAQEGGREAPPTQEQAEAERAAEAAVAASERQEEQRDAEEAELERGGGGIGGQQQAQQQGQRAQGQQAQGQQQVQQQAKQQLGQEQTQPAQQPSAAP